MRLVEAEVIGIICDRLKKVGEMNPTSAKQIAVLTKDYGADMQAIKKVIQKRMNLSAEEVDRIFEKAARDSADLATALAMDRKNVVDTRKVMQQARAAAARYKDWLLNLPDTYAFKMGDGYKPLREAYIAVTNKATLAVHSGALDYNTAIRQEVKRLADNGISVVQWDSGYHRRLDSSVRMNVMEGVRQMNQEILNEAGEKFATGVEISAHDRPAPDHADIQGRQYTKEDYEKLNASLQRPIGTLNCMHIAFPIVYGVTKPTYSDKELEEMKEHAEEKYYWKGKELNGYECTQMQRRYETEIRKSQDKERALRRAGDKEGADLERQNTRELRKEYKAFSEHVGLSEKLNRTGRSGTPKGGIPQIELTGRQLKASYYDVSQEYVDKSMPGIGEKDYEDGYFDDPNKDNTEELNMQDWLYDTFGGDIRALNDTGDVLCPDYCWRNKLWDLKTLKTGKENTVEKRLGHGIKQIFLSPRDNAAGGLIVDYSLSPIQFDDAVRISIEKARKKAKGDFDLIVKKDEEYSIFRIHKD